MNSQSEIKILEREAMRQMDANGGKVNASVLKLMLQAGLLAPRGNSLALDAIADNLFMRAMQEFIERGGKVTFKDPEGECCDHSSTS